MTVKNSCFFLCSFKLFLLRKIQIKGYSCDCAEHYGPTGVNGTCEETNYCDSDPDCPENSSCSPIFGSYKCECNDFYEETNGVCVGTDSKFVATFC